MSHAHGKVTLHSLLHFYLEKKKNVFLLFENVSISSTREERDEFFSTLLLMTYV